MHTICSTYTFCGFSFYSIKLATPILCLNILTYGKHRQCICKSEIQILNIALAQCQHMQRLCIGYVVYTRGVCFGVIEVLVRRDATRRVCMGHVLMTQFAYSTLPRAGRICGAYAILALHIIIYLIYILRINIK